jgi:hypothetical protein
VKRALIAMSLLLAATVAMADIDGAWTLTRNRNGELQLSMVRGQSQSFGSSFTAPELGLTATEGPVRFALRREAGTFAFEGTFRQGIGAGQYTFTPNRAFGAGVGVDDEKELYKLALVDVTTAYVRDMRGVFGKELTLREVMHLRAVGVTGTWLRDMRGAGVAIETAREAKQLAALGVDSKYIAMLASHGYRDLTPRELKKLKAVGVDDDYIRDMKETPR